MAANGLPPSEDEHWEPKLTGLKRVEPYAIVWLFKSVNPWRLRAQPVRFAPGKGLAGEMG
ncbi:hypothetical protein E4U55_001479, partial [Claviceps digitariae]